MPRRLLVALFLSLAVLLAVMAYAARPIFFPPTNPRLTRENFDRIKEGMKRADVEAILGPPGDYRTGPIDPDPQVIMFLPSGRRRENWSHAWLGDKAIFLAWVDPDGTITQHCFRSMELEPVEFGTLMRWRCRRWWLEHIR
jgi:hypothetical protein